MIPAKLYVNEISQRTWSLNVNRKWQLTERISADLLGFWTAVAVSTHSDLSKPFVLVDIDHDWLG